MTNIGNGVNYAKFAPQTALSSPTRWGRKVRTPQRSIAGNARQSHLKVGLGQVQQKAGTGNAVVKPGKLYAVKFQVYRHLRVLARCRRVERWSA